MLIEMHILVIECFIGFFTLFLHYSIISAHLLQVLRICPYCQNDQITTGRVTLLHKQTQHQQSILSTSLL